MTKIDILHINKFHEDMLKREIVIPRSNNPPNNKGYRKL